MIPFVAGACKGSGRQVLDRLTQRERRLSGRAGLRCRRRAGLIVRRSRQQPKVKQSVMTRAKRSKDANGIYWLILQVCFDRWWSPPPSDTQDRIGLFDLNLVEVEDASDLEIRDLFLRLQEGVALNPVEKRNAMPGNMRNFIADLGENQRVFPLTSISEKRFEWHDLTAIVTCLEMAEGPTDVKAYSLRKMYSDNKDFGSSGPIAKKVKRHLAYMAKVLKNRPPEMGIKWGFVDLYLLISKMDESYVIRRREEDFADFYVAFEKERREVMPDHSDLLSPSRNSWDRDLYDYIEAFIRSGGVRQNIEKRHEVYKRRFIRDTQGLMSKDLQRAFTNDERIVIWRRANETCQICRNKIEFDQMEADHIIPHSKGGQTTIDNGQALCKQCNASKGAA